MENLYHLKSLEYLNLALNNISKIEGLQLQLANSALLAVHPCRCTLHNQKFETYIFGFVCQVLANGSKQHIDLQSK